MSTANYVRLGIIFTVTGILALAHYLLAGNRILPRAATLTIGVMLIVLGVPLLTVGVRRRRSDN